MAPGNCLCCPGNALSCVKQYLAGFLKSVQENGLRGSVNMNYLLHFCIIIKAAFVPYPDKGIGAVRGGNGASCEQELSRQVWTCKFCCTWGSQALGSWGIVPSSHNPALARGVVGAAGAPTPRTPRTGGLSKAPLDHTCGESPSYSRHESPA